MLGRSWLCQCKAVPSPNPTRFALLGAFATVVHARERARCGRHFEGHSAARTIRTPPDGSSRVIYVYAYRAEAAPDTDTPMPRFVDTAVRVSLGHQCGARRACSPTERFHASASLMSQLRQVSRPRHAATSGAAERWGRMQATPSLSGAAALRGAVAGVLPCPFPSLVLFVPGSRTAAASGTGAVSSFATSRGVGHSTPSAQEAKEL